MSLLDSNLIIDAARVDRLLGEVSAERLEVGAEIG